MQLVVILLYLELSYDISYASRELCSNDTLQSQEVLCLVSAASARTVRPHERSRLRYGSPVSSSASSSMKSRLAISWLRPGGASSLNSFTRLRRTRVTSVGPIRGHTDERTITSGVFQTSCPSLLDTSTSTCTAALSQPHSCHRTSPTSALRRSTW